MRLSLIPAYVLIGVLTRDLVWWQALGVFCCVVYIGFVGAVTADKWFRI